MIYTKSIQVDIAHQYLNDVIRLHEGDASGAQLQISMFNNGAAFSLTGFTVKYDAVIAGYLAEQDAAATVSSNMITVPITANMCAKSGTLEIDVKIIEGSGNNAHVFFLQKFEAFVQRRVINEDVIIDVSGTTIGAKLAELDGEIDDIYGKMVYIKNINSNEIDTATDAQTVYIVYTEQSRYCRLFCATKGNLRTQYRFDTYGYVMFRKQRQVNGEWEAWQAWTPIASADNIAAGAVSTAKIADGNVTADKLASGAVTSGKLASGAVTTGKLDGGAVTEAKIADDAVTTDKIKNLNVTSAKLATGAVTATKIEVGAVGTVKIADAAVTTAKISDGNVTTAKLAAKAVTTAKIDIGAVTTEKIENNAVTSDEIAAGAVTKAKLAADVKEVYMTLASEVGSMHLADALENGQIFFYTTDKLRGVLKVGTNSFITLARQDDLDSLATLVGNANSLLEAALNYQ